MEEKVSKRPNPVEKCKYFPCHDLSKEQCDCRTCYCPIYEVCSREKNEIFGGYFLKNIVWACEKCSYIHEKETVEEIIKMQQEDKSIEEIYFELVRNYKKN